MAKKGGAPTKSEVLTQIDRNRVRGGATHDIAAGAGLRASLRQRSADHFCQLDLAVRFRKQQNAGVEIAVVDHGVFRIT